MTGQPRADWPSALRRALARADAGKTLDVEEAATLLGARGPALDALTATSARVRDLAFGDRITYSRKVFIPAGRPAAERTTDYSRIEPNGIRYPIPDTREPVFHS